MFLAVSCEATTIQIDTDISDVSVCRDNTCWLQVHSTTHFRARNGLMMVTLGLVIYAYGDLQLACLLQRWDVEPRYLSVPRTYLEARNGGKRVQKKTTAIPYYSVTSYQFHRQIGLNLLICVTIPTIIPRCSKHQGCSSLVMFASGANAFPLPFQRKKKRKDT